jgi:hypothetical protein
MTNDYEWKNPVCKYYSNDPYTHQRCELGHDTGSGKCENHPQYVRCRDYEREE